MDGPEIKKQRDSRGWSLRQLGQLIGKDASTISGWENGRRAPNEEACSTLIEAFNGKRGEPEASRPRGRSRRKTTPSEIVGELESATSRSQRNMPWEAAIERALREHGESKSMRIVDIAQTIMDNQYRADVGLTPANSVSSNLSNAFRRDGDNSIFVRDGSGIRLRDNRARSRRAKVTVPDDVRDEAAESAAELGLIRAFGYLWDRNLVDWGKSTPKLLGQTQKGAKVQDFTEQAGVYVLYDVSRPIYVGQADAGTLGVRLRAHTTDPLAGRWNRFSWFAVKRSNADGRLESLPSGQKITFSNLIKTMEALLIEALEPPRNRKFEVPSGAEYIQKEDPDITEARENEIVMRRMASRVQGDARST